MPENLHKRKRLSSFQLIILGFAGVILVGALLLMLPVSSARGIVTPFDQALFTSTSAVCVTGLVVQDTGSYWSIFGQVVILLLIQTGGLGVVTVAVSVFFNFLCLIHHIIYISLDTVSAIRLEFSMPVKLAKLTFIPSTAISNLQQQAFSFAWRSYGTYSKSSLHINSPVIKFYVYSYQLLYILFYYYITSNKSI